jgi:hypothetical protein
MIAFRARLYHENIFTSRYNQYMTWAARRKLLYASVVGGVLLVVAGIPLYLWIDTPPSCFDGVRNLDELDIDCGGSCDLLCRSQVAPLSVAWSRAFKVAGGYYNVVAYLENPNFGAHAKQLWYRFGVYDRENVLIDMREGTTFITNSGAVPVFETGILTGAREPGRTFFEILTEPAWYRLQGSPTVKVEGEKVLTPESAPRIEAIIRNDEPYEVSNVEVAVVVYDLSGNAMATSRTILKLLLPRERTPIFFTWPQPFPERVGRIEIVPRVPVQDR